MKIERFLFPLSFGDKLQLEILKHNRERERERERETVCVCERERERERERGRRNYVTVVMMAMCSEYYTRPNVCTCPFNAKSPATGALLYKTSYERYPQGPQRVWKVWKKYGICFFNFQTWKKYGNL